VRVIYTDGCCLKNPGGAGGWAYTVVEDGDMKRSVTGGAEDTTNNIMEMTAVIKAIEAQDCQPFKVVSDSKYVIEGIKSWMHLWQRRNWKKKGGPIKNLDLWKRLFQIVDPGRMTFEWVKGHDGHPENERCDQLAGAAARGWRITASYPNNERSSGDSVDTQRPVSNDSLLVGYCPMGCGQTLFRGEGGAVTCSLLACPKPDAVHEILCNPQTEHVFVLREDGFSLKHPLRERCEDELFDCEVHRLLSELDEAPPLSARNYVVTIEDGALAYQPIVPI